MDVLKVFTDEPLPLDAAADEPVPFSLRDGLAPLEDILRRPPYARAYLAGTHLGEPVRTGLTALADPGLWRDPIRDLTRGFVWSLPGVTPNTISWGDARVDLLDPPVDFALAAAPEAVDAALLATVAASTQREGWGALRAILDRQPEAFVLVPDSAHDGCDWVLYAGRPLRQRLIDAIRARPAPSARRLVMPYQKARGEHKFYLERWALDRLPDWAMEV